MSHSQTQKKPSMTTACLCQGAVSGLTQLVARINCKLEFFDSLASMVLYLSSIVLLSVPSTKLACAVFLGFPSPLQLQRVSFY
jgi:hypothetical protein